MDRFWTDTVDRLTFAFQPLVSCRDHRIVAVEALLRGCREAGFRSIQDVFDLASNDRKLLEVETALREKSLRLFSLLPLAPDVKLFSNLDNRVFAQPGWRPGMVQSVLSRTGVAPDRLVLEITERFPFFPEDGDWEEVEFALDDFGTGFSGLKTLLLAKPRYVKIDRLFLSGIDTDPTKQALLPGLIDLARRSGAVVIAEGIETAAERRFCEEAGCDWVQGFAIARPRFNGESFLVETADRQGLLFSGGHA